VSLGWKNHGVDEARGTESSLRSGAVFCARLDVLEMVIEKSRSRRSLSVRTAFG
jgi:hypothetical protein